MVAGHTIGAIDAGLLVLLCAERGDTEAQADKLLAKILKLRIFTDEAGKMNRSVQDIGGGLLVVSQFTLAADIERRQPAQLHATRRRRTKGGGCTTTSWPRRAPRIRWCDRRVRAPTCRCTWSTTGR